MKNANWLITGSKFMATALTGYILDNLNPKTLRIYSRGEFRQSEMAKEFNDPRLRFLIGDIRDKDRLSRACQDIDYIIHTAALKRVEIGEYNPSEFVKTNIIGSMNLVECAIDNGVKKVVALSSDKACAPLNIYGVTKAAMEKIITAGNVYNRKGNKTKLCCTRYGNVIGSTGSVIPLWESQLKEGKPLTLTDERMTRFWLEKEQAISIVMTAFKEMQGGEIFIPKCKKVKMKERAVSLLFGILPADKREYKIEYIGIRPGEKIFETLITEDEGIRTWDRGTHYVIAPEFLPHIKKGRLVEKGFIYDSRI